MPILMQYACFACRKVFKKPMPDQSASEHPCPDCAQPLIMMGTAFRAPRRTDEPQWRKVEQLVSAGVLFCRNSGPRPKLLNEVPAFLQANARAKQSPGERTLERIVKSTVRSSKHKQGPLKSLNIEGTTEFEVAGKELRSWMKVLVRDGNEWLKGSFRSTGDGGKTVKPHVVVGRKKIFIGPQTVLRWPE